MRQESNLNFKIIKESHTLKAEMPSLYLARALSKINHDALVH